MKYEEVKKDLFSVDKKYALGHCVAQDGGMGAGIAVLFVKKFGAVLRKVVTDSNPAISDVVFFHSEKKNRNIYNIVTKKESWGKPTRKTFDDAIVILKKKMIEHGDKYLAIPIIGADLDRLSWDENKATLNRVFADTDIEILVCRIDKTYRNR